jgi:hypothetical protein
MVISPIVAIMIALTALGVAVRVGIGNRAVFNSRLRLLLGSTHVDFGRLPRRLRKRDVVATFVVDGMAEDIKAGLQVNVTNPSRRKVADIRLQLTYPRQFFVSNAEVETSLAALEKDFPERAIYIQSIRDFLKCRTASPIGEMIRVTYDLGTLRPAEGFTFFESLTLPSRDEAFEDERFAESLFGDILRILSGTLQMRALCRVQAVLLSDLNTPMTKWIDVIAVDTASSEEFAQLFVEPYVSAYWLNAKPSGKTYIKIHPWKRAEMVKEEVIHLMIPASDISVRIVGDNAIVRSSVDPLKSDYCLMSVFLPGYDPVALAAGTDIETAILSAGFHRPPKLKAINAEKGLS